ncbi:MAG: aspartate aminotransferase family protein [Candidatus Omnitrophica bacterium]|nr:aspartate aminotransferase family protein [Candidatus Omnitrophota bacterium]
MAMNIDFDEAEIQRLLNKYGDNGFLDYCRIFRIDKLFVKAQGMRLWDSLGRVYRDFLGGYGCLNLGHEHPALIRALRELEGVPNMAQFGINPFQARLSRELALISPAGLVRSLFTNSGAETVEAAIKSARAFTGRKPVVYAAGAYHGKTLATLAITDNVFYRAPFGPPDFSVKVPFNDIKALERTLKKRTFAAFIVEPVQGEGGIIIADSNYLKDASDLCAKYGTVFILDEIQTGLGRTGNMFCAERYSVSPDILLISKSLGGGIVPAGSAVMTERIWRKVYAGIRNCGQGLSTFGGNSRSCACALAAINTIRSEELAANAQIMGRRLLEGLREISMGLSWVRDIRGAGLMIGIEVKMPFGRRIGGLLASSICASLLDRYGIILGVCLNNKMVIRVEPPLIITSEDVEYFLDSFRGFCAQYKDLSSLSGLLKDSVVNYFKIRRNDAIKQGREVFL